MNPKQIRAPLPADRPLFIDTAPSGDGRTATMTVKGELDAVSAPVLRDAVRSVVAGSTANTVQLNLASVTFLDSAGIHCLLICRQLATDTGRHLALLDPSPQVVSVLDITGLLDTFGLPHDLAADFEYRRWRPEGRVPAAGPSSTAERA